MHTSALFNTDGPRKAVKQFRLGDSTPIQQVNVCQVRPIFFFVILPSPARLSLETSEQGSQRGVAAKYLLEVFERLRGIFLCPSSETPVPLSLESKTSEELFLFDACFCLTSRCGKHMSALVFVCKG